MKKFTAILIIVLLVISLFTACKQDETPTTTSSAIEETTSLISSDKTEELEETNNVSEDTTVKVSENHETIIPNLTVSNPNTQLPIFSVDTVKETYLKLIETGKFYISCQQEQESLEYLSSLYNVYQPRLFIEADKYVLVYLDGYDGFLYKNDERLNVHCTEFIDVDSLVDIDGMFSSEIEEVYTEAKKEKSFGTSSIDAMAKEFALRKLADRTGFVSFDYPRFFRRNSEILVIYEYIGEMHIESVSIIR